MVLARQNVTYAVNTHITDYTLSSEPTVQYNMNNNYTYLSFSKHNTGISIMFNEVFANF